MKTVFYIGYSSLESLLELNVKFGCVLCPFTLVLD